MLFNPAAGTLSFGTAFEWQKETYRKPRATTAKRPFDAIIGTYIGHTNEDDTGDVIMFVFKSSVLLLYCKAFDSSIRFFSTLPSTPTYYYSLVRHPTTASNHTFYFEVIVVKK